MSYFAGVIAVRTGYRLTVIEEEQVPLAAAPSGGEYFPLTVIVMVLAAAALVLGSYLLRCSVCRRRIRELAEAGTAETGWSLPRLRRRVEELEAEKIEKNMEKYEPFSQQEASYVIE